ncbi:MFS transporter [Frondihabitans australicus]|uniref:Putative MFS family arabinose efflux permease n=1 Tax=Frondihabitans australicus TaxID=386892 RepID=A0A495IJ95_9MICO|nr:MFS transporter [Frondihabitans australicus]RKR75186.1 putative MFS family arabinose efflux permease [Frondihabitans australicus]
MALPRRATATGLAFLTLSTFIALTSELLPVGLIPEIARDAGVAEGTAGLTVSVFAVCVAVLAVPLARATDHLPRKALLVATVACYALSDLIVASTPHFGVILVGRAVGGVGHALFYSVVTSYTARLVSPDLVGRAMSVVFAGASVGGILGVPIATAIGVATSWRTAFVVMAIAAALLALGIAVALPRVSEGVDETPATVSQRAWWRAGLYAVGAVNALVFVGHHFVYTYVTSILRLAGITSDRVSAVLFALGLVSALGLVAAGALVDRRPRLGALLHTGVMAASLAALAALLAAGLDVPALVVVAVWNIAFAGIGTFMMTAAIRTGVTSPGVAGAFINSTSNVGITIGSATGGVALAAVGPALLPVGGAAVLVAALVVVIVARQGFPARPHRELSLNTTGSIRAILPSRRDRPRPLRRGRTR